MIMVVKERVGVVVSNKMYKIIVVVIENCFVYFRYGKIVVKIKKYKVYDEENKCNEGDWVWIREICFLSCIKCWEFFEIIGFKVIL